MLQMIKQKRREESRFPCTALRGVVQTIFPRLQSLPEHPVHLGPASWPRIATTLACPSQWLNAYDGCSSLTSCPWPLPIDAPRSKGATSNGQ